MHIDQPIRVTDDGICTYTFSVRHKSSFLLVESGQTKVNERTND